MSGLIFDRLAKFEAKFEEVLCTGCYHIELGYVSSFV